MFIKRCIELNTLTCKVTTYLIKKTKTFFITYIGNCKVNKKNKKVI